MELSNKTAIITGVSKGIGLATAKLLLKNGVKVAGWSRTQPNFTHENFIFIQVDVSNNKSVKEGYKQTINKFGNQIDILINNAGLGYEGLFEEMSDEHWHQMFKTNVDSIFYCSRLVIPEMKKMDAGHIINISSIAGTNGIASMAGYCGTKHAVRGISQAMFKELRNFGIKVSVIYPGSVKTNFFDDIDSVAISDNMMMPEDIASTILHVLSSPPNYHHIDIEVRPLRPKGK
ncbi:MAG: SDR family NAD(P)-dependent oxidoreductase [Cyclobacteriaceae bacterium]|nr:SDR family NAD(P)-dependent oxidoreductase [Cyclobacteriaceae bacterium]